MIYLKISSKSEDKINRVAEILLSEKLAVHLNVARNIERLEYHNNKVISTHITRLSCLTKGLLYNQIEMRLKEEFAGNMPDMFSTPVFDMDWDQKKYLIQNTEQL